MRRLTRLGKGLATAGKSAAEVSSRVVRRYLRRDNPSDPSVAWAFSHTGTVSWAALVPADGEQVFARAARHGLVHGLTTSLLRGGSRSMAGFARSDRDFTQEEITELEAAVTLLHDATLAGQALGPEMQDELRRLSVTSTHP